MKKKTTSEKKQSKLWFKGKEYGYGWYPCSKEGWLVLLAYVVALGGLSFVAIPEMEIYPEFTFVYVLAVVVATISLIIVCITKGEKAMWRWGGKTAEKKKK